LLLALQPDELLEGQLQPVGRLYDAAFGRVRDAALELLVP